MASPNINLRDPALYRIKRATHHRTGDALVHLSDVHLRAPDRGRAREHHALDLHARVRGPAAVLRLAARDPGHARACSRSRGRTSTSSRGSTSPTSSPASGSSASWSRRGIVDGWDDPRMPTIVGLRRRGYTPESIRLMCERAGTSKAGGWTDYASLEIALRDDLDAKAPRAMAVLDPLRLELDQLGRRVRQRRSPRAAAARRSIRSGPSSASASSASVRELWIERDDFAEAPAKGFFRLFPGNRVRLKYGRVVECTGCAKDADGAVVAVLARIVPDTRSGTPGADAVKVKGTITWVARRRRAAGRGAPLRPAVHRAAARRRRQGLHDGPATRTASGSCARIVEPSLRVRAPRSASSSSATATSSPTASTMRPAGRCSTASPRCATPGPLAALAFDATDRIPRLNRPSSTMTVASSSRLLADRPAVAAAVAAQTAKPSATPPTPLPARRCRGR